MIGLKGVTIMKAIVYTSDTGHTAAYAKILGEKTGLPVYALQEAAKELKKGTQIIYLGWLFANHIQGYKQAAKVFQIKAICAVGLCDTGTAIPQVRKANAIPESMPLYTMQGGMDKTKLRGSYRFVINMLIKAMSAQKQPSEDDARMRYLLEHDANYVSEAHTAAFMAWFCSQTV